MAYLDEAGLAALVGKVKGQMVELTAEEYAQIDPAKKNYDNKLYFVKDEAYTYPIDNEPTANSDFLVKSGGVYKWTSKIGSGALTTTAKTLIPAVNELNVKISGLNGSLSNIGTYNDGTSKSASVASGSFTTVTTASIPATGIYLITGDISFGTDTNGNKILILSDEETSTNDVSNSVAVSGRATLSKTRIMSLSAGNTIYLRAYQNSGSAMTVIGRIRTVRLR